MGVIAGFQKCNTLLHHNNTAHTDVGKLRLSTGYGCGQDIHWGKKVNISLLALWFGCIVGQKVSVTGWLLYRHSATQQKPILYPSFVEWTPPMQTLLHVPMVNSTNAVLLTINPRHASAEGYSSCACCVLVRFDFSIQY